MERITAVFAEMTHQSECFISADILITISIKINSHKIYIILNESILKHVCNKSFVFYTFKINDVMKNGGK